jgi:hypothetical protein
MGIAGTCSAQSEPEAAHQIEYLSFDDWKNASRAAHVLKLSVAFLRAAGVFLHAASEVVSHHPGSDGPGSLRSTGLVDRQPD